MKLSDEAKAVLRKDFTDSLIKFSGGKVSLEEANRIADKKLNYAMFETNDEYFDKGPEWLAKRIVNGMK